MEKRVFFDDNVLLHTPTAVKLYKGVATLPIVDYHSHLSEKDIEEDKTFSTITEFWLAGDHYKWRAMRSCGIDEKYVTGDATDYEKFFAYASVMPKLIGNPLFYWTHMELKRIFGINVPLNADTAPTIYAQANEKLKSLSVRKLLALFSVQYIATTDDPVSSLQSHGTYDGVKVCPTFRADKALKLEENYLEELGAAFGKPICNLEDFETALEARLKHFISKGCTIADVSVEDIPDCDVSQEEAGNLFLRRTELTPAEKHRFYSYGMSYLAALYQKYEICWQLHIGALRNINTPMFNKLGADSGYDVMQGYIDTNAIAAFLNALYRAGKLPKIILYTLNTAALPTLCTIAASFPNVRMGAAWWFNDTLLGIRHHLDTVAEYSALGTSLGMLTDSRSFSSYCRFDFFRRIISDYVAEKVDAGEYDEKDAKQILYDVCYANPKQFMNL